MALTVVDESSKEFRKLCRYYYYGDRARLYDDFIDCFIKAEFPLSIETFVMENEAVKGINRRVNYLPVDFILDSDEEGDTKPKQEAWSEYFKTDNFNGGPLELLLRNLYREMELGGVAILTAKANPKEPKHPVWVLQTNVEYYPITDPDNVLNTIGYRFVYYRDEIQKNKTKKELTIELVVDSEGYTTFIQGSSEGSKPIPNPMPDKELPVVVFCREELDGAYCRPGMADLLNGSRNLNSAVTKRGEATKYDSFGVFCPKGPEGTGLDLTDDSEDDEDSNEKPPFSIKPSSFVPFPIEKVGTPSNLISMEKEIKDARDDIRSAASFTDSGDQTGINNNESGRAKQLDASGLRDYAIQIVAQVKNSLNRLLEISSKISGQDASGVLFKAPVLEKEDPELVAAKAERMFAWGFVEEALEIEGYNKKQIKTMMKKKEKEDKAKEEDDLDRMDRETIENG